MKTKIYRCEAGKLPEQALAEAGEIVRAGGLVAFPTETVYGLGANALDEKASAKIYAAKGRPSDNPLIVHIAEESQLLPLVQEIPETARLLMDAFWPGPLTMIFNKTEIVPLGTTGGLYTVAVRMPAHPIALALIQEAGVPIAAPSANLSGRPSPTTLEHVQTDLDGRIEMILDGGPCDIGLESTIVDVTGSVPLVLRPGFITMEMLEQVVGRVELDPALLQSDTKNLRPRAPGMKYRHYAPKADMTMVEGRPEQVTEKILELAGASMKEGKKVGVLCAEESRAAYEAAGIPVVECLGSRHDEKAVAQHLYRALREFDSLDTQVIYSETFAADHLGQAIMNRLTKAAGHHCISLEETAGDV